MHRIRIAREQFKFSCAHMTVFPDGTKERLHGHNYTVAVVLELSDIRFENMVPFAAIKTALGALCAEYKEHLFLPERNPHFELVSDSGGETEFRLCGQRYLLPSEDVIVLPIDNIAVEPLAAHVAGLLLEQLRGAFSGAVSAFEVTIDESPGQGASCRLAV